MIKKRAFLRTLLALASACTLTLSSAQEPESSMARVQRTKVLRVGAIAGAIPYFNKDLVSGKWEGFGPDFSENLAKKLGAKVEYVETTWGNAVLDLQSNKIDAMFGMAPTPARKEVVNFSDTLFDNTYTAVCKKGFPTKTWEQLNAPENKIVVDVGSSHDQLATRPTGDFTAGERIVIERGEEKVESAGGRRYWPYKVRFPDAPKRSASDILGVDKPSTVELEPDDAPSDADIPF